MLGWKSPTDKQNYSSHVTPPLNLKHSSLTYGCGWEQLSSPSDSYGTQGIEGGEGNGGTEW